MVRYQVTPSRMTDWKIACAAYAGAEKVFRSFARSLGSSFSMVERKAFFPFPAADPRAEKPLATRRDAPGEIEVGKGRAEN